MKFLIFLYFNKRKTQKKLVRQKNRYKPKFFLFDKFMFLSKYKRFKYIFVKNTVFIELKMYKFFIKKLRKLCKKKKFKAYIYFCCNGAWFRKTKNSRMGKGKGKFVRYMFRSKIMKPICVLLKISNYRLVKFIRYINNLGDYFYLSKK